MDTALGAFEADVQAQPRDVRAWRRYLAGAREEAPRERFRIFERALRHNPRSYMLWRHYLLEREQSVAPLTPTDPAYKQTNRVYERALVALPTCPRLWILYIAFLCRQPLVTKPRQVFNKALQALPLTQHDLLWPQILNWSARDFVPAETRDLLRARHAQVSRAPRTEPPTPEAAGAAARWLRRGFPARASELALAAAAGARTSVEFAAEFEAAGELENGILLRQLGALEAPRGLGADERRFVLTTAAPDVTLALADAARGRALGAAALASAGGVRFTFAQIEALVERRDELDLRVQLRQAPGAVQGWMRLARMVGERVALREGAREGAQARDGIYLEALERIPAAAHEGNLAILLLARARLEAQQGRPAQALKALEDAAAQFRDRLSAEETRVLHTQWAELVLKHEGARRAVVFLEKRCFKSAELRSHPPLWGLRADCAEYLDGKDGAGAVYRRALAAEALTPRMALCWAALMHAHGDLEGELRALELSVGAFPFPAALPLAARYLERLHAAGERERAGEAFETCLERAGPRSALELFFVQGRIEERAGFPRRAAALYRRMARAVPARRRDLAHRLHAARICDIYGPLSARGALLAAVNDESLTAEARVALAQTLASVETAVGEVDRARAVFAHFALLSAACDEATRALFWNVWRQFEVTHGNSDTLRQLLIQRRTCDIALDKTRVDAFSAGGAAQ
eukprot:gnl/Chilomastix_cuspidata/4626.p1 GENE.gnl/Chilomastix_cuspidata/4626~~gnl/Chilomastix_cuspidata/4626.p1  ORF type:complete len:697 (-),score=300.18 gnl/Chilomastix_cuspidata/4626:518-2608(-)